MIDRMNFVVEQLAGTAGPTFANGKELPLMSPTLQEISVILGARNLFQKEALD